MPPGLDLCSGCGKCVGKKEEVCLYSWEPPGVLRHSDSQKATPEDHGKECMWWWWGEALTGLQGEILKAR